MREAEPVTTSHRLSSRSIELADQGVPFVQATVVRAQCPTSARPGDGAIILADGSVEGFIGGQCAEGSVRVAAAEVLESGDALLLRIMPDADPDAAADEPGARTVVNPCLSGGAIEVFLEPKLPSARICVVGNTPIADALVTFGEPLGFAIDRSTSGALVAAGALAVIVSSHGRGEEDAIAAGLAAGVGFIGLVASRKRAEAVIDGMQLSAEDRAIVRSPVGIDIGARTAPEIALSILGELVREVRTSGLTAAAVADNDDSSSRPEQATDPICGMTVLIDEATPHLRHDDTDYWYCNVGCRTRHSDDLVALA